MDAYLPLIVISFLAAFVATPLIGKLARHTGFVDEPQPHKMHVRPIPLLGGLAIYLALAAVLFKVDFGSDLGEWAGIGIGGTLLMLVGLWDDRRGMAPRVKLLAQVAAGLIAARAGIVVHLFPWDSVNLLITLLWFVGITNAINLMDNIDGLAAGVSAVSAVFFMLLAATAGQGLIASLAAAVTGASLGFLYYNISPAMVFMGDTGSLLLGFLLAVIGIRYSPETLPLGSTWMVPIVVLGLPIFDTTLVTYARLRAHRPVSQGGTDHTSHRLAHLGLGINRSVMTMYLVSAALGTVAVLLTGVQPPTATAIFIGLVAVGLAGVFVLERARPMPPANPQVVLLAEDGQAEAAIRAARQVSSNITVVVSPHCAVAEMRSYLRALALAGEPFAAWLDGGADVTLVPARNWHEVYRLAGQVIPYEDVKEPDALRAALRDARLIVLCRGKGWPAGAHQALESGRSRLLLAPGAEFPGGRAIPAGIWDQPAELSSLLEDAILGYRRKELTA